MHEAWQNGTTSINCTEADTSIFSYSMHLLQQHICMTPVPMTLLSLYCPPNYFLLALNQFSTMLLLLCRLIEKRRNKLI